MNLLYSLSPLLLASKRNESLEWNRGTTALTRYGHSYVPKLLAANPKHLRWHVFLHLSCNIQCQKSDFEKKLLGNQMFLVKHKAIIIIADP